jgi:hypothetical protein
VALCNVLAIEQGLGKIIVASKSNEVTGGKNETGQIKADAEKTESVNSNVEQKPRVQPNVLADPKSPETSASVDAAPKAVPPSVTPPTAPDILNEKSSNVKDTVVTETAAPNAEKVVEPISPTSVSQASNTASAPPAESSPKEPEVKDPSELIPPASDSSNIHSDDDAPSVNGQKPLVAGQGGRESVWQKLSNRIKVCC